MDGGREVVVLVDRSASMAIGDRMQTARDEAMAASVFAVKLTPPSYGTGIYPDKGVAGLTTVPRMDLVSVPDVEFPARIGLGHRIGIGHRGSIPGSGFVDFPW